MITTKELWVDAQCLADQAGGSELRQRLAVDALYYAAFLAVRRLLGARRSDNPHGEHEAVIRTLKERGKLEQRAANRLDSLRKARNKARYDVGSPFTEQDLLSARSHAEAVVGLLPQLFD